jgi:hypothetical protein
MATESVIEAPPVELPQAPPQPEEAAKADASKKKKKKSEKAPKDSAQAADVASVAAHPRAAHQVARSKGFCGLGGFLLGGYLSLPTHTLPEVAVRALAAGVICYLVAWAGAVFIWRRLVVLEIKAREHQLLTSAHESPGVPAGDSERARTGMTS